MRNHDSDYKRNGTATLFAALNTLDGTVISMCDDRHRHEEGLQFLRVIDDVTPAGKQLLSLAKMLSGVNAFEITDVQEEKLRSG